jgi:hypothetical protein
MIVIALALAVPAILIGFATGRATSPDSPRGGLLLMLVLVLPVLVLGRFAGPMVGAAWGLGAIAGSLVGRTWRSWVG